MHAAKYSPFRSAGISPPRPTSSLYMSKSPVLLRSKRRQWSGRYLPCLLMMAFLWWSKDWWSASTSVDLLPHFDSTKDWQFVPATNPKIQYVGRWITTLDQLGKAGAFSDVYFEFQVTNSTRVLLALRNTDPTAEAKGSSAVSAAVSLDPGLRPNPAHLSFHRSSALDQPASPVSLLARIDNEEYVLLPDSSSLVSVSTTLTPSPQHQIRIMAANGTIQLEGIWLDQGGELLGVAGTQYVGIEDLDEIQSGSDDGNGTNDGKSRKLLEIITDSLGGHSVVAADSILSRVMAWEHLLGELFDVDHAITSMDGMCMVSDCIGGTDSPSRIGDVFFRSGPPRSAYFEYPWTFPDHTPDALVLNLGRSDAASFAAHEQAYNKTAWDLSLAFEDTYVSLVKAIRQLAYPGHPASSPQLKCPIFVMRPFGGALEHATQAVVDRLRADGDKRVFWLDTSGWLPKRDDDGDGLTAEDNRMAAEYMGMHLCRYLADNPEQRCPFLAPDVYRGNAFSPQEAELNRVMETAKERKLKELFWGQMPETVLER